MTSANGQKTPPADNKAICLLTKAYDFAARAHADQRRKGKGDIPYINHPCTVAMLAAEVLDKNDFEAVAAAVLHDVVEDCDVAAAEIEAEFGPRVASIVTELTDAPEWQKLPMPERKVKQAEKLTKGSREARIIKIADQTSNIRDLLTAVGVWSPARNQDYLEGARIVVDACRGVAPALEAAFDEAARAFEAVIEKELSK